MVQKCKHCGQFLAGTVFPCKRFEGHEVTEPFNAQDSTPKGE